MKISLRPLLMLTALSALSPKAFATQPQLWVTYFRNVVSILASAPDDIGYSCSFTVEVTFYHFPPYTFSRTADPPVGGQNEVISSTSFRDFIKSAQLLNWHCSQNDF